MPLLATASAVDLKSAMTTAFTQVATDINSYISAALPIALGVIGTVLAIKIGINVFKSITGKV